MRTRKIAAIALSAMMGATLFAGCGSSDSNADSSATEESTTQEENAAQEESASTEENAEAEENADAEASSDLSGSVSTNGSTSMESVIGTLMEQFMADNPGVTITYDPTGSGTGIEAATNGTCDIGLASRALKEEETGLVGTTLALDGIAIIVNANNEVTDLTIEDIAGIFTGEITNWSELGGADLEISPIGREAGSGTRDGFESITETEDLCQLDQELTSTGAVIQAVSSNQNAIGYASLSAVEGQEGITAILVNGVECSEATVLDGTYEIQRPFTLVTKEGEDLSEAAQAFFDYMVSADAADLIREAGAVPVVE